jgi:hypothetical protein
LTYQEARIIIQKRQYPRDTLPHDFEQNHGAGGSEKVRFRPQKSLDMPVERFLASLRFEQRRKLDQLAIEIGSLDTETGK